MAKRFTDTDKWRKNWFTDLTKDEKLLWVYMLDHCDYAGIYEPNWKLTNFMLDTNFDDFPQSIVKQIEQTNHERRWFISDFIDFQYGVLKMSSPMHKKVYTTITKYGLSVATEGGDTLETPRKKKIKNKIKVEEKKEDKKSLKSIDAKYRRELQLQNLDVDVEEEFIKFSNDLSAKGRRYKDYRAAFRNWLKSPYAPKTTKIRNKLFEEKQAQERKKRMEEPTDLATPEEIREALGNITKVKDKMEWKTS
jgi:hypothetical protein